MKKKKQLSLAQALGDLSKINPDKLLGLKVVFERDCNNIHGTRIKKKKTVQGNIKEWAKTPGFVIIQDESGGLHSRDLSNVWGDVLE